MVGNEYNFVHQNISNEKLDFVKVKFGNFQSACGILPAGGKASHMMVNRHGPVPDEVTVQWFRVRDGKEFEKKIKLRSLLPSEDFSGDIVFYLNGDDVTVHFEEH